VLVAVEEEETKEAEADPEGVVDHTT